MAEDGRAVTAFRMSSEAQKASIARELHDDLESFVNLVVRLLPNSQEAVRSAADLVLRRKAQLFEASPRSGALRTGGDPGLQTFARGTALLHERLSGP